MGERTAGECLHGCDVFSTPAADLERVHVEETRKGGNESFCVEGGREREGEDVETGA